MTEPKLRQLLSDARFRRDLARSGKLDAERSVAGLRSDLAKAEATLAAVDAELATAESDIARYECLLPPPRKRAQPTQTTNKEQ
jgi:hypothetical protein